MSPPYPAKEQSLPEKLALAREDAENWAQVAATPNLSPKAAAWAQGIVRSSKAAVSLYEKAMAFQQERNGQSVRQKPLSKTRHTLPLGDERTAAGITIARAWDKAKPISQTPSATVSEAVQLTGPLATTAAQMLGMPDDDGSNDSAPKIFEAGSHSQESGWKWGTMKDDKKIGHQRSNAMQKLRHSFLIFRQKTTFNSCLLIIITIIAGVNSCYAYEARTILFNKSIYRRAAQDISRMPESELRLFTKYLTECDYFVVPDNQSVGNACKVARESFKIEFGSNRAIDDLMLAKAIFEEAQLQAMDTELRSGLDQNKRLENYKIYLEMLVKYIKNYEAIRKAVNDRFRSLKTLSQ